jgi:Zn-dependent hydrolases, including glyoxylases
MEPRLTRYSHGITAIDTEYVRPGLAAAHLIVQSGRAAFVDSGTNASVPLLLKALDILGVGREAVDYVCLTHVHLDHAGGAGQLMQALPNARAVLHPRGAPHMIDPAKLIAGSIAVYGEDRFRQLYGEIVPIAPERVISVEDGTKLGLAGRELEFVHTPGHALHHYAIVDRASRGIFTGDTFGLSYRDLDTERGPFIVPTTTPPQFDPDQLLDSIDRLLAYRPEAMYLTHFGRVADVPRLAEELRSQIREFARIAERHAQAPDRHAAIRADMRRLWLDRLRAHGSRLPESTIDELLGQDLDLNTQGLVAWLDRKAAKAAR